MTTQERDLTYLVAHIEEALATDARTNSLDVRVTVAGNELHLTGSVACEGRRQALEEVTRELLPLGLTLINRVVVEEFEEPEETETL